MKAKTYILSLEKDDPKAINKYNVPDGVEIFEINGPFFFGAAYKFKDSMRFMETAPKILIIRMRHVPVIDATGIHTLSQVYKQAKIQGTQMILSGVQPGVYKELEHWGFMKTFNKNNILTNIDEALNRANALLESIHKNRL